MSSKHRAEGFLLGTVLGGLVAGTTALLFAPKSGKELRKDISDQADDLKNQAVDYANEAKAKGQEVYADAKAKGEAYYADAKAKGEELYADAKAKGDSVYADAKAKGEEVYADAKAKGEEVADKAEEKIDEVKSDDDEDDSASADTTTHSNLYTSNAEVALQQAQAIENGDIDEITGSLENDSESTINQHKEITEDIIRKAKKDVTDNN